MKKLLSFLLAWPLLAMGVPITIGPNMPAPSSVRFVSSGMSYESITNLTGTAEAGTLIYFFPGRYIIPTNHTTWLRPGVNYYFYPGAEVRFGTTGDGVNRPVFRDTAATTNYIAGYGALIVSNAASPLISVTNSATKLFFEAGSGWNYHASATAATIYQTNGIINAYFHDELGSAAFNAYEMAGIGSKVHIAAGRRIIAGNAIALGNYKFAHGECVIESPRFEQTVPPIANIMFWLTEGMHIRGDFAKVQNNSTIFALPEGGANTNMPIFEVAVVDAAENTGSTTIWSDTPFHIKGTTIYGAATGQPPVTYDGASLVLENVQIHCGNVLHAISQTELTGDDTVTIIGSLYINREITNSLYVNGYVTATNMVPVVLAADNQSVSVTNIASLIISSDNGTAANRTFTLTRPLYKGAQLKLTWSGTNQGELADDGAISGGGPTGAVRLSAVWPTAATAQYDSLLLEYNGTDWIEIGRSGN